MSAKKAKSFEEDMDRLEQIVAQLEQGEVPLAASLALFEEGAGLVKECTAMLEEAEQKVVALRKGPGGDPEELPFQDQEDTHGQEDV